MATQKFNYFMRLRPPAPGAMPNHGLIEIDEYDRRIEIPEICGMAWAKLTYNRKLAPKEIYDYDLVPEFYDVRLTKSDINAIFDLLSGGKLLKKQVAPLTARLMEVEI